MIQELRKLRKFNWPLFISLCALSLLPAIYQTIKTFIISTSNDNNVFNILGQMEWYDLINETLIAFLIILPALSFMLPYYHHIVSEIFHK